MTTDLTKSPTQLKYEQEKVKNELTSLLNNSQKKKEESLSKMLHFRAEIKELDAVMAAREESYACYCALAQPLLNLVIQNQMPLPEDLAAFYHNIVLQIKDLTAGAEAERLRISRHRAAHQTQLAFIRRKSKEIYSAMQEEKKSASSYATLLQAKIQELEEQFRLQTSNGGLGIGL